MTTRVLINLRAMLGVWNSKKRTLLDFLVTLRIVTSLY